MTDSPPVLCFGELMLRLTPPNHELLLQSPRLNATFAGSEANVAVALSSMGTPSKFLSTLPENELGTAALNELRKYGVGTSLVSRRPGRMGVFYFTPGAVTRASSVEYDREHSSFAVDPLDGNVVEKLHGVTWVHLSGITPALNPHCTQASLNLVKQAKEMGCTVSFDCNYRSKLWKERESEAPGILKSIWKYADHLFADYRDISLALQMRFEHEDKLEKSAFAARAAFAEFPSLKSVSHTIRTALSPNDFSYGAQLITREGRHIINPVSLLGVADRLGSGDAFAAGIIHGRRRGWKEIELLRFAHAAACLKHSIRGDFLTLSESQINAATPELALDVQR